MTSMFKTDFQMLFSANKMILAYDYRYRTPFSTYNIMYTPKN